MYQFLRYLHAVIDSQEGDLITIEGAIEDIDISSTNATSAIQCKYHETVETFTLGKIYKPILLMLEHFANDPSPRIPVKYQLYCHFPNKDTHSLTKSELETVLATKNQALKIIAARIPICDLDKFISIFSIEFGPSFDELETSAIKALVSTGFSPDDVRAIVYPAAIQRIVDIATKASISERTLSRAQLIGYLREIKHVTLTRWTRELATKSQMLKRLQSYVSTSMSANARSRYFVIDGSQIQNFDDEFPLFIKRYMEKYNFKYLHSLSPYFFMADDSYDINSSIGRIYDLGFISKDGVVGGIFRPDRLFSRPIIARVKGQPATRDFHLGICKKQDVSSISGYKPDDLFFVNSLDKTWDKSDVNMYIMEVESLNELEYILKLRTSYD